MERSGSLLSMFNKLLSLPSPLPPSRLYSSKEAIPISNIACTVCGYCGFFAHIQGEQFAGRVRQAIFETQALLMFWKYFCSCFATSDHYSSLSQEPQAPFEKSCQDLSAWDRTWEVTQWWVRNIRRGHQALKKVPKDSLRPELSFK